MYWEVVKPDGTNFNAMSERGACKLAKVHSQRWPGRWTAQRIGSEGTVASTRPYKRAYEGGLVVEKGRQIPREWEAIR